VEPRGKPRTARRWFSNWLVTAPSIVQCRNCGRAGPFVGKQLAAVFEKFDGEHADVLQGFENAAGGVFRGALDGGLEARGGARERRRMPLRWWFSTSG